MKIDRRGKAAGQQQSDLRVCGGQGRGRTADLPIFSRSFGEGVRHDLAGHGGLRPLADGLAAVVVSLPDTGSVGCLSPGAKSKAGSLAGTRSQPPPAQPRSQSRPEPQPQSWEDRYWPPPFGEQRPRRSRLRTLFARAARVGPSPLARIRNAIPTGAGPTFRARRRDWRRASRTWF